MTELFSDLIIWYLFLGGVGGGTYLVTCAIDLLARTKGGSWKLLRTHVRMPLFTVMLGALVAGTVCLLKDLARSEQALLLFAKPTFTPISVGAFTLSVLIVCTVMLVILSVRDAKGPAANRARNLIEALGSVAALIVIVYTGALLAGMPSVPLWDSPALPAVFALSALSCGIATALATAAFVAPDLERLRPTLVWLMNVDTVIIVLEIATVALLFLHVRSDPVATASIDTLTLGPLATRFWIGFVLCGTILPVIMEAMPLPSAGAYRGWCLVAAGLVLLGGFFLRYCAVAAGMHLSLFMFA